MKGALQQSTQGTVTTVRGWHVKYCKTSTRTLQLLAHAAENITVKVNVKEVGVELDVRSAVVRRQLRKGIGYHVRHWRRVRVAWP